MTILCEALTRHGRHEFDALLTAISSHIVQNANFYRSKELVSCLRGFRKANLAFPQTAITISERLGKEALVAAVTRTELKTLSISRLCFFVDSIAYFGYDDSIIQNAVRCVCLYLTDRVDSIPERSALRISWSIALYGLCGGMHQLWRTRFFTSSDFLLHCLPQMNSLPSCFSSIVKLAIQQPGRRIVFASFNYGVLKCSNFHRWITI